MSNVSWSFSQVDEEKIRGHAEEVVRSSVEATLNAPEQTREHLTIDVARNLKSEDVLEQLSTLFVRRGAPTYMRGDNGSEFTATKFRQWLERVGVKTILIGPRSSWENGSIESFNDKLPDELLAREQFNTLLEAKVLIERWRRHDNTVWPHSSLGYRPPAPEAIQPASIATATLIGSILGSKSGVGVAEGQSTTQLFMRCSSIVYGDGPPILSWPPSNGGRNSRQSAELRDAPSGHPFDYEDVSFGIETRIVGVNKLPVDPK